MDEKKKRRILSVAGMDSSLSFVALLSVHAALSLCMLHLLRLL